jgi:hypothetical protein
MRNSHLRQEQGGIDGFGAVRAQDGGQDGTGGDVDGDRQLRPAQAAVFQDGHNVQAGGVDLYLLPGTQHYRRRRGADGCGGGTRWKAWTIGWVGQHTHQPVERRP